MCRLYTQRPCYGFLSRLCPEFIVYNRPTSLLSLYALLLIPLPSIYQIHEIGWQKIKQIATSLKGLESGDYPVAELDFTDLFDSQQPTQHAFKTVGTSSAIDAEIQKYKTSAQYVDSKGKPLIMFDGLAEYWQVRLFLVSLILLTPNVIGEIVLSLIYNIVLEKE